MSFTIRDDIWSDYQVTTKGTERTNDEVINGTNARLMFNL